MLFKRKDKDTKAKYVYLRNVILRLKKDPWDISDLKYIYNQYLIFLKKIDVEEIAALRTGEIFLGKYCNVDYKDINDVKDLIYKCFDAIEEITPNVCTAITGALVKLAISEVEGKEDFNELKEEL